MLPDLLRAAREIVPAPANGSSRSAPGNGNHSRAGEYFTKSIK